MHILFQLSVGLQSKLLAEKLTPTFYRLSTIQAADRIVVMDGGKIVEVCSLAIFKYKFFHLFQKFP